MRFLIKELNLGSDRQRVKWNAENVRNRWPPPEPVKPGVVIVWHDECLYGKIRAGSKAFEIFFWFPGAPVCDRLAAHDCRTRLLLSSRLAETDAQSRLKPALRRKLPPGARTVSAAARGMTRDGRSDFKARWSGGAPRCRLPSPGQRQFGERVCSSP